MLHLDSRLVLEQLPRSLGLGRGWATGAPHLAPYQELPGALPARLRPVWVPRARDRHADGLVARVLDTLPRCCGEPLKEP